MTLKQLALISFVALTGLSCQQTASSLEVIVSPQVAFAIDANAYTCVDIASGATKGSMQPLYYRFRTMELNWKGKNKLGISYVKLTATGNNLASGTHTCTLSPDEIALLFGTQLLDPGTKVSGPTVGGLQCRAGCGGLTLIDDKRSTTLKVTIKVVGYEITSDSEIPVTGLVTATIRN